MYGRTLILKLPLISTKITILIQILINHTGRMRFRKESKWKVLKIYNGLQKLLKTIVLKSTEFASGNFQRARRDKIIFFYVTIRLQSADKQRTFYEFVSTGLTSAKMENSRARTKLEIVNWSDSPSNREINS